MLTLDEFREYMIERFDEKIEEMYYNYLEDCKEAGTDFRDALEALRARKKQDDSID